MALKRNRRLLECGFLGLVCAGSLLGIYLFSIGPVMVAAARMESSTSKPLAGSVSKAQKFYEPWWWIHSHCPAPVRFVLDEYTELWFRGS